MLKIRFKKFGCKHKPFYRIVLIQNKSKRDGKALKILGYYNPLTKKIKINKTLLYKYILIGAYPTNTIRHLIVKNFFI
jgi:small subunit ribosomal protein S16